MMRTSDTKATEGDEREGVATSALAQLEHDTYSRQKFLRLVGGVGAAGALSVLLAACGEDSDTTTGSSSTTDTSTDTGSETDTSGETTAAGSSDTPANDLEIVNYALTLEYLEADFYAKVIESGLFSGKELDLIKVLGQHEAEHVTALEATAKSMGTPAPKPTSNFPLESREAVLDLAAVVENLGASAYLGQAGNIKNKEVLAAALSIHTVEARHAAALNQLTGKNPTPDEAFAKPATMAEVLEQVKPFIAA